MNRYTMLFQSNKLSRGRSANLDLEEFVDVICEVENKESSKELYNSER